MCVAMKLDLSSQLGDKEIDSFSRAFIALDATVYVFGLSTVERSSKESRTWNLRRQKAFKKWINQSNKVRSSSRQWTIIITKYQQTFLLAADLKDSRLIPDR